jgi:L-idonate 5-dehydrogenase
VKAAVLHAPYDLRIEDRGQPAPTEGWVAIAVEAAGICGTDIAVYQGRHEARLPRVLGHEFSGRILGMGEGVSGLERGQRVMAEGSWPTESRALAIHGATSPQPPRQALGRTVDGCFAEAVVVPAKVVHRLPEEVSALEAQAITTLATAVHAASRAGDLVGRRIGIVGPGHAGLLLLQVCLIARASSVVVLGTRDSRLKLAQSLGAQAVVNVRTPAYEAWLQEPANKDFEILFEASGTAEGLATCLELARSGGRIVAYGIINSHLDAVPGQPLYSKELNILGSRGAGSGYEEAIRLLSNHSVKVESLVTHVLPIREAKRGLTIAAERLDDALRVVLVP